MKLNVIIENQYINILFIINYILTIKKGVRVKTTSKKFNGLKIEGTYDFSTFCVALADYSEFEIAELNNVQKYIDAQDIESIKYYGKLHALLNHEYQHFLDATATTWGVGFLTKLSNAYELQDEHHLNNPEFKYFIVKDFINEQVLIEYPYYYSLNSDDIDDNLPWELRPTIGSAFDYKGNPSPYPIMFASFFNKSKQRFVRTPISLITLLECSAVIQEIRTQYEYSKYIKDAKGKLEFFQQIDKTYKSLVYDRNLTEYSSCFHLVANNIRSKDLVEIITICEVLVEICLNFNNDHFHKISNIAKNFTTKEFEDKLRVGLKNQNRGILFFALNHCFVDKKHMNKKAFIRELDVHLRKYDLSYSKVMREAEVEINRKLSSIEKINIPEFGLIAESVKHNFKKIYRESHHYPKLNIFDQLYFPKVQCNYDKTSGVLHPNNNIGTLDPYILDKKFSKYFKWAREFSDACFITDVAT